MTVRDVIAGIAEKLGFEIQGEPPEQAYRDNRRKADGYSVEAEMSEALADLVTMFSSAPVSGDSERARWIDANMDRFFQLKLKPAVCASFLTGDCLIVPSWNGRSIQHVIADTDSFEVLSCVGDELTAVAYKVDEVERSGSTYQLMQAVELVSYDAADGSRALANRYRMFVTCNGTSEVPLSRFPAWAERYEPEWVVPNVDRLLVGRLKSFTVNPEDLNAVKGAPICFGASDPISEIHYLLEQMHDEFELSEKVIIAGKRLFKKEWEGDSLVTRMPRGRERLFMSVGGSLDDTPVTEWSPAIRYEAYLEALDKQEKLVERAVGVSSGIISTPDDVNYQNVDNVRKSQQKTMGFVDTARRVAESCLADLVYAWDVLANYYNVTPIGTYEVSFDWSNEYVETFADKQQAILAGESIGATDAVDYRMFVMDESPDAARQRVDEIKAAKAEERTFTIKEA